MDLATTIPDNQDHRTVSGFGDEWTRFDQSQLSIGESSELFESYFKIFPWDQLGANAVGFDLGCGSGRWARHVAPKVGQLHCIDASSDALSVAQRNLANIKNCLFHVASVDDIPLRNESMDFGYCLGVLHHVPDTLRGISSCVEKLKPGAPFLLYLYYAFDNRPFWFRLVWRASDLLRRMISRCPHPLRYALSQAIAATVYLPLARLSKTLESLGMNVSGLPLAFYRNRSFYTMRTDALDRFGTFLEQRFSAPQIKRMMTDAGLEHVIFSEAAPFWCAVGYRSRPPIRLIH